MPKVFVFVRVRDVRSQLRELAASGLHVAVDLDPAESVFGDGWDREARELGRTLRTAGLACIARGPGADLPLATLDPWIADQVRACHDRGLAAATNLGATHYLVRLGSLHGLARSERLARREAAAQMLADLAVKSRARGLSLQLQHRLEADADCLELAVDAVRGAGGSLVFSPARALKAGFTDLPGLLDRFGDAVRALELTDLHPADLEPWAPGQGVLAGWDGAAVLRRPGIEYFCVEPPARGFSEAVQGLNALVAGIPGAQRAAAP